MKSAHFCLKRTGQSSSQCVKWFVEDSFIIGQKLHLTKSGGSEAGKPWTLKSGGSRLGAVQKFTPMSLSDTTGNIN